jgi:hypothetical protein
MENSTTLRDEVLGRRDVNCRFLTAVYYAFICCQYLITHFRNFIVPVVGERVPTVFGLMTAAILDHWSREKNIYFNHMTKFVDLVADISHYTLGTEKCLIFRCCKMFYFLQ